MNMNAEETEVWAAVQAMNRLWTTDRQPERLAEFFHADMIAVPGNEPRRREGRAACVAGWKAFTDVARVTRWEEREPSVRVFAGGQAAVVHYYYDMTCEIGGQVHGLRGRDTFVLTREDGRWWVLADHFSAYPGAQP